METAFLSFLSSTPSLTLVIYPKSTKRSYIAFPCQAKLIPERMNFAPPPTAMDLTGYGKKYEISLPEMEMPDNVLLDVRLTTYHQPRQCPVIHDARYLANSPKPGWIRLHGAWLSYINHDGKIVTIRRSLDSIHSAILSNLIRQEKLLIRKQLSSEQISHMPLFWFDNQCSGLNFIASQGLKHGSLCIGHPMVDYYKISYNLTNPFFNGGEKDIRHVFQKYGIELGKYHDGLFVRDVLKEVYGCYPCLNVRLENGHPVFDDLSFLYVLDSQAPPKLVDHLNFDNVPEGDLLFRSNDFS